MYVCTEHYTTFNKGNLKKTYFCFNEFFMNFRIAYVEFVMQKQYKYVMNQGGELIV